MPIKVTVPENIGGELRQLPEDTYTAAIQDIFGGLSKASNEPKVTVKWVVKTEFSGDHGEDYKSTIGENVLDTYSLQEKAMFRINGLWKQIKGENIPQADYELDEFVNLLKSELVGAEFMIDVVDSDFAEDQSKVNLAVYQPSRKTAAAGGKKKR